MYIYIYICKDVFLFDGVSFSFPFFDLGMENVVQACE